MEKPLEFKNTISIQTKAHSKIRGCAFFCFPPFRYLAINKLAQEL